MQASDHCWELGNTVWSIWQGMWNLYFCLTLTPGLKKFRTLTPARKNLDSLRLQAQSQTSTLIPGRRGKGEDQYICIAPYCRQPTSKALRYFNALSRDLTVLPAHPRIYLRTEWTIPAFAFPAEAGTHLLSPKGWKAELAWETRTVIKQ